jgi:lipopolysaccharide transport system permease protein
MTETLISADQKTRTIQYIRDLWNYRDLFRALVERDIKVRYKQTVFGLLWVIIPPLVNTAIFYIVFVRVVEMSTQGLSPLLFFLSALIPWNCFASGVSQAASSLETSAGLISKVYFPRLIVPAATILATIFDFLVGWFLFNIIAAIWGLWTWLFIPFTILLLCLQLGASMGFGLILAALNAQYRDVKYVVPWLIQVGMWITPVVWPLDRLLSTRFGHNLEFLVYLNPMAGVIESYRALLLNSYVPYVLLAMNFLFTGILFFSGIWLFRKREQRIIDLI